MPAQDRAYLELTKPGITLFVGMSAAAGFVAASGGLRSPGLLALTLIATMLMSAGAATLNQVSERTWDSRMRRTAARPVAAGLISPRAAARFGRGLGLIGVAVSLAFLPLPTTIFLILCHISYVDLYTPLKRRTPLCTLAGAIPGALPVLAGWTATGTPIGVAALALAGVLFMWQIPHFLAIGWMAREDYRIAGFPMLGVVDASGRSSARVSLVYAAAMGICATVVAVTSDAGMLYAAVALPTGVAYVGFAERFVRRPELLAARRLFFSSLLVLPLLLGALISDLVLD